MGDDAERIVSLYERHALEWAGDRSKQQQFFEKGWLDRFLEFVRPGGTILDLGCGFGKPIAAYSIEQGFHIYGVDSSPTMISLCEKEFPGHRWVVSDMRKLDLGMTFDGILAWDSFFHLSFDDQRRMFAIFRAHAASAAPLLFTSGPKHGEAIGRLHGEALYHASLDPAEYRAVLASHDFTVVDARMEDAGCGGHSVWLARRGEHR
ncbi:MAG: class I SAM-dependent methyltransferase [Pseudolabrys sp.]|nr:class I SAM-dependent methyltransferase [Pseudolabrys sp.]